MTGMVPIMWAVWGAIILIMFALKLYTGRLTRDEDDHLVLDAAFDHFKSEQAALVEKVHKIEPFQRVSLWLAVAATVFVIGYYLMDFLTQFK